MLPPWPINLILLLLAVGYIARFVVEEHRKDRAP